MLLAPCEILLGIIDNVVGPDGAKHLELPPVVHGGNLGSVILRNLNSECAHATASAIYQDLLPFLEGPVAAKSLEGDLGRLGEGGSILKGYSFWFTHQ